MKSTAISLPWHDLIPESDELGVMLQKAGFSDIQIDDGTNSYFASATKPRL